MTHAVTAVIRPLHAKLAQKLQIYSDIWGIVGLRRILVSYLFIYFIFIYLLLLSHRFPRCSMKLKLPRLSSNSMRFSFQHHAIFVAKSAVSPAVNYEKQYFIFYSFTGGCIQANGFKFTV